jgi:hypothetical protein
MGAIKDVVDLTTQLANSVQDRKFSAELFKIIKIMLTIQGEQTRLAENNLQLMSYKAKQQELITSLKAEITQLKQHILEMENSPKENVTHISDIAVKVLELFFSCQSDLSEKEVAAQLNLEFGVVSYHFDELRDCDFIQQAAPCRSGSSWIRARGGVSGAAGPTFKITPKGKEYVVKTIRK